MNAASTILLTRRDDLIRDQLARLPLDAGDAVRVGVTGTGPDLLVLTWSASQLASERAAGMRVLRRLGVEAGTAVANTLPGALATPGALLFGDVVEELGGLDVPLGVVESPASARQAWELLERVRPPVIVLDDASAPQLFAAAPAGALDWWRGVVRLWSPGPAAAPPAAFAGWQRSWLAVPEVTSFVAGSCVAGRFHADDAVQVEVIDETEGAGASGGLAVTVRGEDMRYSTGIHARAVAACSCGTPGAVFEVD